MADIVSPTGKPQRLAPVHPNAGITARYRRQILALIRGAHDDIARQILEMYRRHPPEMARDISPTAFIMRALRSLVQRWQARFEEVAPALAGYFGNGALRHSDVALSRTLRDAGFTVRFQMTPAAQDILDATISEQVALITNIGTQYLSGIETAVLQSVQRGGDLKYLSGELEQRYGIARRRAELIARDQNAKATANMTRARQDEIGITEAIWLHSGGGRHPRKEHVAFSRGKLGGPVYDINKGAYLEGVWTWPGHEINCRCVSKPLIPGLYDAKQRGKLISV